jgi:hypothetical protein
MLEKDVAIIRQLAQQVAEIASLPIQEKTRNQWIKLNGLRPERSMFLVDEIPWHEMNVNDELTLRCENPFYRELETNLRRQLYRWNHIQDDFAYEPVIYVPMAIKGLNHGLENDEETIEQGEGNAIQAHHYKDQLQTEEDLEKIKVPNIWLDVDENNRRQELARQALEGILEVVMDGPEFEFRPWDKLVEWRGFSNLFDDIADRPEFIHQAVDRIVNTYLATLDILENNGWLMRQRQIVHCTGGWTDELPKPGYDPAKPRTIDCWTYGMAQILYMVSPEMHDEFEFQYAPKWYGRFGLGYYGCCEPLDDRIEKVLTIPNIRKISVSAWVKKHEHMAEVMDKKYVFSNKPSPACLVGTWDPEGIETHLKDLLNASEKFGCPSEFTLKDISTVGHKPHLITEWSKIMRKVIDERFG